MIHFGGPAERLAALLHEARMQECYGNWQLPSRFKWPQTREEWAFYQHNPHSAIDQAMAQAKAMIKAGYKTEDTPNVSDPSPSRTNHSDRSGV